MILGVNLSLTHHLSSFLKPPANTDGPLGVGDQGYNDDNIHEWFSNSTEKRGKISIYWISFATVWRSLELKEVMLHQCSGVTRKRDRNGKIQQFVVLQPAEGWFQHNSGFDFSKGGFGMKTFWDPRKAPFGFLYNYTRRSLLPTFRWNQVLNRRPFPTGIARRKIKGIVVKFRAHENSCCVGDAVICRHRSKIWFPAGLTSGSQGSLGRLLCSIYL